MNHHGSNQIMMEGRDNSITLDNSSNVFGNTVEVPQHHELKTPAQEIESSEPQILKKELQPQQTGDFPSPSEIKKFNHDLKQEILLKDNSMQEEKSEEELPKFSNE